MDSATAERALSAIRGGRTLNSICSGKVGGKYESGSRITFRDRFQQYCREHPSYAAEVDQLLSRNAGAANLAKGAYRRSKTHCKNGHPLTHDNIYFCRGIHRKCKICCKEHSKSPPLPTDLQINKVTAALNAHKSLNEICRGEVAGRKVGPHILNFQKLMRYRMANPDYDQFVRSMTAGSSKRGWARRRDPEAFRLSVIRAENNDYYSIKRLLPASMLSDDRDDVVMRIFTALCDGSLRRDQVQSRVREFIQQHHRDQRNGIGQYGMISLDAPIFSDSTVRRIDTISQGLWD